ncbi:putative JmjC domain protein [Aspergillus homomorphus CBS 101889]|uniref:Clavaminate synthase-like protein n=1 Tax=Aspergillus homomorphus (strain CBS 101889) TaxID=1450537 RepID=A0A395IF06_ASPHC|nr:Clavaminate synthase-like protein [Aspergillus homomorphus CBS 101889]RAL16754.1 Clavaminate synthase-like protein [Aspergillus homomorphus CBS 101889]
MSVQLPQIIHHAITSILEVDEKDPIVRCCEGRPEEVSRLLLEDPAKAIKEANSWLHVFPYKDVDACWLRLYTDASILKACLDICDGLNFPGTLMLRDEPKESYIRRLLQGLTSLGDDEEIRIGPDAPWLTPAIHMLDRAIIMTGAPLREAFIELLISSLQTATKLGSENAADNQPEPTLLFSTLSAPAPEIKYPIPRVSRLSFERFQSHIYNARTPLVITDAVGHWPALSTRPWSSRSYWNDRTFDGRRLVPVELGRAYTDKDWGQKIIPFGEFIDKYIDRDEGQGGPTGYLAQHDLLTQIPALRKDIGVPDYCYIKPPGPEPGTPLYLKNQLEMEEQKAAVKPPQMQDQMEADPGVAESGSTADDFVDDDSSNDPVINTWIGPSWTISPLHHDPYHNIFVQVVGAKYIRLYSPHTPASQIYPKGKEVVNGSSDEFSDEGDRQADLQIRRELAAAAAASCHSSPEIATQPDEQAQLIDMSNTSQVDLTKIEMSPAEAEQWEAEWPGFLQAEYVETVLKEGECLYIPVGWWHYVRSLQGGISVSFWWE